jgi:hypothetical protein
MARREKKQDFEVELVFAQDGLIPGDGSRDSGKVLE